MNSFSIIMPCYLGEYKGAASNREEKLIRAIDSVISQTYKNWELIIIADGCEKTFNIVCEKYMDYDNIECFLIDKQNFWSGAARNFGISKSNNEIITYLDSDDYLGINHLQIISDNFLDQDWVWYNDIVKTINGQKERECQIKSKYQYGTSNISHKRHLNAMWNNYAPKNSMDGYGQDDYFLGADLIRLSKNYSKIKTPEYIVCHQPNKFDF